MFDQALKVRLILTLGPPDLVSTWKQIKNNKDHIIVLEFESDPK